MYYIFSLFLLKRCCRSVAKLCPTLWPHGLQHARRPCPSLSSGVGANSCPLSQWCHLTISSSAAPFSFCLQSFFSIRVFPSESAPCTRWSKYWSFNFCISPSSEYSGLMYFLKYSCLQCCASFCCTTKWLSSMCTHTRSLLDLPLTPPPSTPVGHHRAPSWAPWDIQELPTSWFTHGRVYTSIPISQFIPSPHMSIGLFSTSVSLFLPCK